MCGVDVSVSRRTGLLGWVLHPRVLVFVNDFWASSSLCTLKISASAVELRFEDEFWDSRDSVVNNGLSVRSSFFPQKMSASAVELGLLDDFLGQRVLVFVNGFSATSSSLCTLKISASAVQLGFEDDFWDTGAQFSSTVCLSKVVYFRRRC